MPDSGRMSGFYLGVEGLGAFTVYLNDREVARSLHPPGDRTVFRTIDLSRHLGSLNPGDNVLRISADSSSNAAFIARAWVGSRAWYIGSLHAHTTYSDGKLSVRELLRRADSAGADFYALTDHNILTQCRDSAFRRHGRVEPIQGLEWTDDSGHANVLGPLSEERLARASIPQLIDDARYRGGLVQINHPYHFERHFWRRAPTADPGIDLIEVLNGSPDWPQGGWDDSVSVAWWAGLVAEGRAITAVGNSDYHGPLPKSDPLLVSCIQVFASTNSPDSILSALKLGRAIACGSADSTRLWLLADTNRNGRWDLVPGERIRVSNRSGAEWPLRFRLEVISPRSADIVRVFDRQGMVLERALEAGQDFIHEWTKSVTAADTDFVRAELVSSSTRVYRRVTNPIYVNYPDPDPGPTTLRTALRPGTPVLAQGRTDTLAVQLSMTGGYSPFGYGVAVALDTLAGILAALPMTTDQGALASARRSGRFSILEWCCGYERSSRLTAADSLRFCFAVRPRQAGCLQLLHRSWTRDRLGFTSAVSDKDLGLPDRVTWEIDNIQVRVGREESRARDVPAETRVGFTMVERSPARLVVELLLSPDRVPARLTAYDDSGRLVRELAAGMCKPGKLRLAWDLTDNHGRRVRSGVYFLKLSSPAGNVIRKVAVTGN
ncbi:MAG: CehA/McbA family metallohydrolase [candidate division WOR-3 bacterium]|nr:MAG: CehA/McbA family metallohydrolase [candidate division WOR-3 bacterium]